MRRSLRFASNLLLLALGAMIAQGQAPQASGPAPVPETGRKEPYRLQRGDVLDIKVYNLPELSVALAIRPDGKISVPLLDEVEAAGLTAAQLAEHLTNGYQKEFRNPRVTVIVRSFSNQTIYVGGEVAKPGLLPLAGDLTAFQAIVQAGGVKETAKTDSVMLLRNDGQGKPMVRRVSLEEILKGKPDTVLQPFDVVFVPKSRIARVDKWVDQHIRQMIPISLGFSFNYLFGSGTSSIF